MFRLARKSVQGNLLRLALTLLAVVLGVSFVSGTLVLTDSIDKAFDDLFTTATQGIDVYVNPVSEVSGFGGGGPPGVDQAGGATLDESLVEEVLAVDGVEGAIGFVQGITPIIGEDGEPLGGFGPPTLGFSWVEGGATSLREGRAPEGPDEVVIDVTTATDQGFELGQEVRILTPLGVETFTMVGTSGFGEEDNLLGASTASFTLSRAQELYDKDGQVDQIAVSAADGVDTAQLRDDIEAAVGAEDVQVISVDEEIARATGELDQGLAFLDIVLLSFAGVSLFVGGFLIVNTFAITVAQRMREFALLRAVGASAGQLRRMVLMEAGLIGLLGGTLGVVGGILLSEGLQALFGAIGVPFPDGGVVLRPRVFIASYVIAMVVTVLAALLPARRASRVAPVEALRGTGGGDAERIGRMRTVLGALLMPAGIIGLLVGLFTDPAEPAALVGAGVAALFVGVALLAPWIAPPVTIAMGRLLGDSVPAVLARRNTARNPTRTSTTASALMIGVALVSFISIMAASINASVAALLADAFRADLVLTAQGGFGTLPSSLSSELAQVDGVESVSATRVTIATSEDLPNTFVNGIDAGNALDHVDFEADPAVFEALTEPDTVLVSDDGAERLGLAVGDTYTLSFAAESDVDLEVVGIFENGEVADGFFLIDNEATYRRVVGGASDQALSLVFDEGADFDTVRGEVESVTEAYPGTAVQDVGELLAQVEDAIGGLLNIMIGLLVLALVIAVIGIVNTLALSVVERTREIGLLRAVGTTRAQVRSTVRRESILVATFGALLGVLLGTFFGWALVTALASQGIEVLAIPALRLTVYVLLAAVAGVVAAVLPARRAARLDVLQAVTTE